MALDVLQPNWISTISSNVDWRNKSLWPISILWLYQVRRLEFRWGLFFKSHNSRGCRRLGWHNLTFWKWFGQHWWYIWTSDTLGGRGVRLYIPNHCSESWKRAGSPFLNYTAGLSVFSLFVDLHIVFMIISVDWQWQRSEVCTCDISGFRKFIVIKGIDKKCIT